MTKFRKKPIEVEATQWFKNGDHSKVIHYYCPSNRDKNSQCKKCGHKMYEHGWIDTLEGGYIVCPGDYIITGVKGECYPCKPDIFEATYEPV